MKSRLLLSLTLLALPVLGHASSSSAIADIVRAQVIIGQVQQTLAKLKEAQGALGVAGGPAAASVEPVAPEALTDSSGKFFLPYDQDGQLCDWANKALGAQVGAALGSKAGEKVGQLAASKIPVPFAGSLLAKGAKKKGKQLGALAAVGGAEYVKSSSSLSFATLEDMSLYLHLNCSGNADYIKAFAAAMAIYPDLEKTYQSTVKKAYAGR